MRLKKLHDQFLYTTYSVYAFSHIVYTATFHTTNAAWQYDSETLANVEHFVCKPFLLEEY